MKIVICDDNAVFGKDLVLQLKAAFMRKGYSIEIKSYNDPKDLIEAEDVNVDAYFLDIEMPGMDGIELADFLKQQKDSEFIFVSVHDDMLRQTMKVKPVAFVRKAFLEEDINEAVDNFLKEYARKKKTIALQDGKQLLTFCINDIIYFYSERDYVVLCLEGGKTEQSVRQKLDAVEKQMSGFDFLRIHNRYLINMRKIVRLHHFKGRKSNEIEMSNGKILPVSKRYVDSVKMRIFDWFRRVDT